MADERWLRDLNHDPDLVRLAGDDVDKLIKSTREELDYADRIMRSGRPQEPEFSTPQSYRKEVFQPKIPDIYADWTQEEEEPEEPIKPPRKRLAAGWRVLIYVVYERRFYRCGYLFEFHKRHFPWQHVFGR